MGEVGGLRRPTAGQPKLLRLIVTLQSLLPDPHCAQGALGEEIRPIAGSIRSLRLNNRGRGL